MHGHIEPIPCTPHACVYSSHHHWTHFLSSIHSPPIPHPFISHLYAHLFLLTHLLFPPPFFSLSPPTHFLTSCPLYSRPISCTGRYICKAWRWSCWMFLWNAQPRDKIKWRCLHGFVYNMYSCKVRLVRSCFNAMEKEFIHLHLRPHVYWVDGKMGLWLFFIICLFFLSTRLFSMLRSFLFLSTTTKN